MKREMFLTDRQFRRIARIYFSVAGNTKYNANPFKDLSEFLQAKVGDLKWGNDENARNNSKTGFAQSFARMLDLYNLHVTAKELMDYFSDDKLSNEEIIEKLVSVDHR